jgi:hypothetical protein
MDHAPSVGGRTPWGRGRSRACVTLTWANSIDVVKPMLSPGYRKVCQVSSRPVHRSVDSLCVHAALRVRGLGMSLRTRHNDRPVATSLPAEIPSTGCVGKKLRAVPLSTAECARGRPSTSRSRGASRHPSPVATTYRSDVSRNGQQGGGRCHTARMMQPPRRRRPTRRGLWPSGPRGGARGMSVPRDQRGPAARRRRAEIDARARGRALSKPWWGAPRMGRRSAWRARTAQSGCLMSALLLAPVLAWKLARLILHATLAGEEGNRR